MLKHVKCLNVRTQQESVFYVLAIRYKVKFFYLPAAFIPDMQWLMGAWEFMHKCKIMRFWALSCKCKINKNIYLLKANKDNKYIQHMAIFNGFLV